MKTNILILLFLSIFAFGCSSDDSKSNSGSDSGSDNEYSYLGDNFQIERAEYLVADGDLYLFFQGSGVANYIQVIFADVTEIPVGSFTYNNLRYSPSYNPQTNFWSGAITTEINPLGYLLTDGSLSIAQSETGYDINFNVTDSQGTAIGRYNGQIVPR
ncbi:hypothetical protein [Flavobacterium sp.]|uniref:hypothetical protein n=1 Tax=Flavobacterium sp. TaxID=239 RepID=UPI0012150758|nr:hypothetical protein [Flavobacterium sp.]RZJ69141.1 MAG: hypothetical protein EOO49_18405 [Flavobacterium sp.]